MAQDDDEVSGPDEIENDQDDSTPAPVRQIDPILKQHLDSVQAMKDAQARADRNSMYSGLARAAATMGAGLAGSNQSVNQQPFDALDREAQAPVQNVMNQQKAAANDITMQGQMRDEEKSAADSDPNSPQSTAMRNMIKTLYPGKFDEETLSKLSAADIGTSVMKPLELDQKIQASKQEHADKAKERADAVSDKTDAKTEADQSKAYTQMRKDLESFRGNQAVQQAAVKVQNADTALAIVKGKDPNSLTSQDLRLLAEEMGKIATGGVPGEHGTEALMPNNLRQKLAEMQAFLTNKPTDAQAGDYIKHNMEYLDQMKQVAQGTLTRYRQNIAKGYKGRVKDDDYSEAMSDYSLGGEMAGGGGPQAPDLHASVAAEIQRRQAAKAQGAVASTVPNLGAPNAQGVPSSLQPNQPPGFAYGGMVGGLPSSNFAASQMGHTPHQPALHLHSPRGFADGGQIPGQPQVPGDNPVNDRVPIMATPKEVVLPLHITQAKDPALAAYLYMKQIHGKVH